MEFHEIKLVNNLKSSYFPDINIAENTTFFRIFLLSYAVGSTINDSPDCMWIKRSSLYLRPALSLCHRGCWRGMCIINNIGSLDLKSSFLVLHLSYNWPFTFYEALFIPLEALFS